MKKNVNQLQVVFFIAYIHSNSYKFAFTFILAFAFKFLVCV